MTAATDYELPAPKRTANRDSMTDARLFSLIDELAEREKRRDALLDRMTLDESDAIEAAAKKACDDARAIYERIAAIKPTTAAGVLHQLELAARGWIAPSTVSIAMTAFREIVDRPPPFKAGRLPPVPPSTVYGEQRADFVVGVTARLATRRHKATRGVGPRGEAAGSGGIRLGAG